MKKLVVIRYLACVTLILILFSILAGESLAAKTQSESGNRNQYSNENNIDEENYGKNSSKDTNAAENSNSKNENEENKTNTQDKAKYSMYVQERKQAQEELQLQKNEYREAKEDFLKVRNQIQSGKLNPNSEEAMDATKLYLKSSISYMIAHLKNVKTNMQYSNGNGTKEKINSIDEDIKLLEAEKAEVENASSQQELIVVVKSVREIWNNAQKTSLTGAGQTVSERIGEFLNKSDNLSKKLDNNIEVLNATGVDTAELETRLTSYKLYIKAAQEKKEAADSIYEDENATQEELVVANNYLRESLNNVNKANQILRVIFEDLKEYNLDEVNEIGVENSTKT